MPDKTELQLETIVEINSLINSPYRNFQVLMSKIMESSRKLIGAAVSIAFLVDRINGPHSVRILVSNENEFTEDTVLNNSDGISRWLGQFNRPVVVNNDQLNEIDFLKEYIQKNIQSLVAVPLRGKDRVVGAILLMEKNNAENFEDKDVDLLQILADQASIGLQNASNFDRLNWQTSVESKEITVKEDSTDHFIWNSSSMGKILEEAKKMAPSNLPILILGESGTGKELIAEYIHKHSNRTSGSLIRINCAAIPQELIEPELFGYIKGAFTDAIKDKSGYFERADGGTLFLDEIAELNIVAQSKILRVLQQGCFERVGGENVINVDVRIVAATNKNLNQEVDKSNFRQDLYYRLAVLTITIPPLRSRLEDIEMLARHFLKIHQQEIVDSPEDFSLESLEALLSYDWPGNVRELENAVRRAVVTGRGKQLIVPTDLGLSISTQNPSVYAEKTLKDAVNLFKKNFIREIIKAHDGNQTSAARALGIQRTYLSRLIQQMSINHDKENVVDE